MTQEEHIICAQNLRVALGMMNCFSAETMESLDEAIKSLEQKPSEDEIILTKEEYSKLLSSEFDNGYAKGYREALEQEPRWIPVSERLPEEDGDYLLFGKVDEDEDNYIFIGEYDSCGEQFGIWQEQFDRTTLGCLGSEFYEYASVLAWMPLPEPYKEEMESD